MLKFRGYTELWQLKGDVHKIIKAPTKVGGVKQNYWQYLSYLACVPPGKSDKIKAGKWDDKKQAMSRLGVVGSCNRVTKVA